MMISRLKLSANLNKRIRKKVMGITPPALQLERTSIAGRFLRLRIPVDDHNPYNYQPMLATKFIIPFHTHFKWADECHQSDVTIYTDSSKTDHGTDYSYCLLRGDEGIHMTQMKFGLKNSMLKAERLRMLSILPKIQHLKNLVSIRTTTEASNT